MCIGAGRTCFVLFFKLISGFCLSVREERKEERSC